MRVVRYFRDLEAWQSAMDLAVTAHGFAGRLPTTHRFELASQMRRAATSIPSNIAEGHAQRGDRVFLRHVRIALGSLAELETQVEIAVRLNLVEEHAAKSLQSGVTRTGQLLHGLRRTLKASTARTALKVLVLGAIGGLLQLGLPS